jgi:hypothetical protein
MRRSFNLVLFPAISLVLVSCGPSQEEAALAHVAARKPPGFVRLINFSGSPVGFRVVMPDGHSEAQPGEATKFFAAKPGPVKIEMVDDKGNELATPDVSVDSKQAVSILLTDKNGKGSIVTGEENAAPKDKSSICAIADAGMEAFTAVITGPGGKSYTDKLGLTTAAHEDAPGKYSVKIQDASGKTVATADVDAVAGKAYTVVVVADAKGTLTATSLINNPMGAPAQLKTTAAAAPAGGGTTTGK